MAEGSDVEPVAEFAHRAREWLRDNMSRLADRDTDARSKPRSDEEELDLSLIHI